MKPRTTIALVLLGGALLIAIGLWPRRDFSSAGSSQPSPFAGPQARVTDSESQIDRLSGQVASLAAKVRQLAENALPGSRASDAQARDPVPEQRPRLSEAERKQQLERRLELLAQTMANEPSDPTWSHSAAESLKRAYAAPEFAGVAITVECKTTLCRSTFRFDPEGDFQHAGGKMVLTLAPWSGRGFMKLDPSLGSATYYLAREDNELPTPPEDTYAQRAPTRP